MTDKPTPAKIKAFIDDLARISMRHGFEISEDEGRLYLDRITTDFEGYSVRVADGVTDGWPMMTCVVSGGDYVSSIDLTKLSNHQRLAIMGGQG
ncbi:hypothetical protein [Paracoccus beibuensis]|uniref:hypothetical protein n=1 Tax=Paracoccus beibuensis TaxID=547602 RepID=UPI00223FF7FA|nr:hypothetical protein [Paracoccus beibuensis]